MSRRRNTIFWQRMCTPSWKTEVTRKLELIEMGISEEEQAAREAEEAAKAAEEAKQQAAGESTEPAPSETSQPEAVG